MTYTPETRTARFSPERVKLWAASVLEAGGASRESAHVTADCLVFADRRGTRSHGLVLLEVYVDRLQMGTIDGSALPVIAHRAGAVALVDGANALGPVVGVSAVDTACELAESYGVSAVGVRRSNHLAAAAYYTLRAAGRGFFALLVSNTDPAMAPRGARRPVLGTNPIAIAAPRVSSDLVPSLDMATSVVAQGRIAAKVHDAGGVIPAGWACDAQGRDTMSAAAALEGFVLPAADHKGFGLAFMADVLAGCLTGAPTSPNIRDEHGIGHFIICLSVTALAGESYYQSIDALVDAVHGAPTVGETRLAVPGEPEASTASASESVSFDEIQLGLLAELAEKVGVRPLADA